MDPLVVLFITVAGIALSGATAAAMNVSRGLPPKPRYRRSLTQ